MTPEDAIQVLGPACQAAMKQNGGFASVRMAQIAQESAWVSATPKDINTGQESYNLTGVKGDGLAGSVLAETQEWDEANQQYNTINDYFAAYHSFEESIMERDKIFTWSNYDGYRNAGTPEDACWALQNAPEPYATDPNYAQALIDLISEYNLKDLDSI